MFTEKIKGWIEITNKPKKEKSWNRKAELVGLDLEAAYKGIMNETIPIEHNDKFKRDNIKNKEVILQRGVRTPDQILEDIRTETSAKDLNNLNGEKPSLPEGKSTPPEGKSTLYSPKPSINL